MSWYRLAKFFIIFGSVVPDLWFLFKDKGQGLKIYKAKTTSCTKVTSKGLFYIRAMNIGRKTKLQDVKEIETKWFYNFQMGYKPRRICENIVKYNLHRMAPFDMLKFIYSEKATKFCKIFT